MRGKAPFSKSKPTFTGITPAYAGKSCALFASTMDWLGSPPPMRGKGGLLSGGSATERITPAYAGKRRHVHRTPERVEDHPRLCGEKCKAAICEFCVLGSPPPMRGKGTKSYHTPPYKRITPAYAGKSDIVHRSTRDI